MKSKLFQHKEQQAVSELASRKNDYETYKALRLKNIVEQRHIEPAVYTDECTECDSGHFEFSLSEYDLSTFTEVNFGNEEADGEKDFTLCQDITFFYCTFLTCSFSNMKFLNCRFIGCTFSECFSMNNGVVFDCCSFSKMTTDRHSADDMFSYFRFCELTAAFRGCEMNQMIFSKTNFYFSTFKNNNMSDLIMAECGFELCSFCDCGLNNTRIVKTKFTKFTFTDTYVGTKVNRNTFFGPTPSNPKDHKAMHDATDLYFALAELFQENRVSDLYGEYFFQYKRAEMLTLNGIYRLKALIAYLVCGFGERPFYSLITAFIMVFVFGNIYFFTGLMSNKEILMYNALKTSDQLLNDLLHCYHFSLVTFTTVGYGNVYPYGISFVLSGVEMVLGVMLVGIWVSALVRKMVR